MKAIYLPAERLASAHPLTINRDLGDCPVANHPLRELQEAAITAAGHELIDGEPPKGEPVLFVNGMAWFHPADLAKGIDLCDAEDNLLCCISVDGAPPQNKPTVTDKSFAVRYPWDLLRVNAVIMELLHENEIEGEVKEGVHIDGNVTVGKGTTLLPGVYIEGNVIIGENCKIGPNCYLRGPVAIGDNCHIGNAVEIKASIIMEGVNVGHLSYVGDSIIGKGTNFGAGTITANFRHDGKNHRAKVDGNLVDTGCRKLGAIIGDDVHTGVHTSIYPARMMWPNTNTRPGDTVQKDIHK